MSIKNEIDPYWAPYKLDKAEELRALRADHKSELAAAKWGAAILSGSICAILACVTTLALLAGGAL